MVHAAKKILKDRDSLKRIISDPGLPEADCIIRSADEVRRGCAGNMVYLRGLIEFSNYCVNNCKYCGLRRDNRSITRYRMTAKEIIDTASQANVSGYGTVVLQSGEDPYFTGPEIASIVREIRDMGLVVTLSVGERDPDNYEIWRKAGAERYLMRHETADPELFSSLRPGRTLKHRLELLKILKGLDYQTGSGFMTGLPGQTADTLLADIDILIALDTEMAGIGPFIPHPATPLRGERRGNLILTRLMVALTRIALPHALIPATTAAGVIDPCGMENTLSSGANVVMPVITPERYRRNYEIYPGKTTPEETGLDDTRIKKRIESTGLRIANGPGHNTKWLRRRSNET